MTELAELRHLIENGQYPDALLLVQEMEEMSWEDKISKIYSYVVILLTHLIKQAAENRTTRSWERSIYNSVQGICITNKRRKSGGFYLKADELIQICEEAWPHALKEASFEAFEGRYEAEEIAQKVDAKSIGRNAMALIERRMKI